MTTAARQLKLTQLILENPFPLGYTMPERMRWSASSVKLWRRCKRKWFWRYGMRLRPRYREGALMIGDAFHTALAEWYRGARSSMPAICKRHVGAIADEAKVNAEFYDQDEFDKLSANLETLSGMLIGYADSYSEDRKMWTIKRDHIEIEWEVDMGDFDYIGKIDLLKKEKGKWGLVEHKTASKIEQSYIDRLPLDTQCRSYIFGAIRGLDIKPQSILYDVVRKCKLRRKSNETADQFNDRIAEDYVARPDFYFFREDLRFSMSDIDALEYEIRQAHAELQFVIKTHDHPDNPRSWMPDDAECNAFFRLCPFHKLCTSGLDRGTGHMYLQRELEKVEDAEDDE